MYTIKWDDTVIISNYTEFSFFFGFQVISEKINRFKTEYHLGLQEDDCGREGRPLVFSHDALRRNTGGATCRFSAFTEAPAAAARHTSGSWFSRVPCCSNPWRGGLCAYVCAWGQSGLRLVLQLLGLLQDSVDIGDGVVLTEWESWKALD